GREARGAPASRSRFTDLRKRPTRSVRCCFMITLTLRVRRPINPLGAHEGRGAEGRPSGCRRKEGRGGWASTPPKTTPPPNPLPPPPSPKRRGGAGRRGLRRVVPRKRQTPPEAPLLTPPLRFGEGVGGEGLRRNAGALRPSLRDHHGPA